MEEINEYDVSLRKDSVFDKIHAKVNKHWTIRFNNIALEYEIYDSNTGVGIDFNESSLLIHLHREKIKTSSPVFKTYLRSHFVKRINPLTEYYESLPTWNGEDHIKKYASYINTDDNELFYIHLLKWAVRAVKTVFLNDEIN